MRNEPRSPRGLSRGRPERSASRGTAVRRLDGRTSDGNRSTALAGRRMHSRCRARRRGDRCADAGRQQLPPQRRPPAGELRARLCGSQGATLRSLPGSHGTAHEVLRRRGRVLGRHARRHCETAQVQERKPEGRRRNQTDQQRQLGTGNSMPRTWLVGPLSEPVLPPVANCTQRAKRCQYPARSGIRTRHAQRAGSRRDAAARAEGVLRSSERRSTP